MPEPEPPRHLDWGAEQLWQALVPLLPGLSVEVVARCDSTNTQLLDRARRSSGRGDAPITGPGEFQDSTPAEPEGAPFGRRADDTQPCLLVAEHQTRGRGRLGRTWQSSPGASLTFSLSLPFSPADWSGLSLAVGVSAAEALHPAIRIKWPNDLLVDDRKLAGILVEASGEIQGPSVAVVGVGVNYRLGERMLARIDQPVTDVRQVCAEPPTRSALLAALLRSLATSLDAFDRDGFAVSRGAWRSLHAYHGRAVRVIPAHEAPFDAEVLDVAADGTLVVATADGRSLNLSSAEISLRGK